MSTEIHTIEELEENPFTLAEEIGGSVATGLRKGCYGTGSGAYYQALNPLFFNPDKTLKAVAEEHVRAMGEAAAPLMEGGASNEEIGQAMKAMALVDRPCFGGEVEITPENQGQAILKELLPLSRHRYATTYVYKPDEDGDITRYEIRDNPDESEKDEPYHRRQMLREEGLELASLLMLNLLDRYPEMKKEFGHLLGSPEPEARKKLLEGARQMEDSEWASLADWCRYCLQVRKENEEARAKAKQQEAGVFPLKRAKA